MQACASFYVPTLQCPQEGLSSLHGPLQGISSDFQNLDPREGKRAQERIGVLWRGNACPGEKRHAPGEEEHARGEKQHSQERRSRSRRGTSMLQRGKARARKNCLAEEN